MYVSETAYVKIFDVKLNVNFYPFDSEYSFLIKILSELFIYFIVWPCL